MVRHQALRALGSFLWEPPPLELTSEKRAAFEAGRTDGHPVHEHLRWLVAERPVLVHGTGDSGA